MLAVTPPADLAPTWNAALTGFKNPELKRRAMDTELLDNLKEIGTYANAHGCTG
jgi:hypothetical protein